MKTFLILFILLFFLPRSFASVLQYEGRSINLIHDKNRGTYLSENCSALENCFFDRKVTLRFYPDQSPGFSLCYQIGGEPFFGTVSGLKETLPLCKKGDFFADHEALLLYYRDNS